MKRIAYRGCFFFPIQLEIKDSRNKRFFYKRSFLRETVLRGFEAQFRWFDESPVRKRNGPVSRRNRRLQAAVMAAYYDTRRSLIGSK